MKPATASACSRDNRLRLRALVRKDAAVRGEAGAAHPAHDAVGVVHVVGNKSGFLFDA